MSIGNYLACVLDVKRRAKGAGGWITAGACEASAGHAGGWGCHRRSWHRSVDSSTCAAPAPHPRQHGCYGACKPRPAVSSATYCAFCVIVYCRREHLGLVLLDQASHLALHRRELLQAGRFGQSLMQSLQDLLEAPAAQLQNRLCCVQAALAEHVYSQLDRRLASGRRRTSRRLLRRIQRSPGRQQPGRHPAPQSGVAHTLGGQRRAAPSSCCNVLGSETLPARTSWRRGKPELSRAMDCETNGQSLCFCFDFRSVAGRHSRARCNVLWKTYRRGQAEQVTFVREQALPARLRSVSRAMRPPGCSHSAGTAEVNTSL